MSNAGEEWMTAETDIAIRWDQYVEEEAMGEEEWDWVNGEFLESFLNGLKLWNERTLKIRDNPTQAHGV